MRRLLLSLVAVLLACTGCREDGGDHPRADEVTVTRTAAGTVQATVEVHSVTPGGSDEYWLGGRIHEAAKTVWRTEPGRVDVLEVTARLGPSTAQERWARDRLTRTFGARAPGLDAGRPADPLPTPEPMPTPATELDVETSRTRLRQLMNETVARIPGGTPTDWKSPEAKPCTTGDDHHAGEPTGKSEANLSVTVDLPAGVHGESVELVVARYWASRGLTVDPIRTLPMYGGSLTAPVPGTGQLYLRARYPPNVEVPHPHLTLTASTGCHHPLALPSPRSSDPCDQRVAVHRTVA